MTRSEFITTHGTEVRRLHKKGFWGALLELLDAESPARKLNSTPDNDLLHGGVVFASKTAGHEGARALLSSLNDDPATDFEPPTTFAKEEQI